MTKNKNNNNNNKLRSIMIEDQTIIIVVDDTILQNKLGDQIDGFSLALIWFSACLFYFLR